MRTVRLTVKLERTAQGYEMEDRIGRNLAAAIETMRNACDDAERRTKDGGERSVQQVLHALSWGFANASSSIETAMAAAEDGHEIKTAKLNDVADAAKSVVAWDWSDNDQDCTNDMAKLEQAIHAL